MAEPSSEMAVDVQYPRAVPVPFRHNSGFGFETCRQCDFQFLPSSNSPRGNTCRLCADSFCDDHIQTIMPLVGEDGSSLSYLPVCRECVNKLLQLYPHLRTEILETPHNRTPISASIPSRRRSIFRKATLERPISEAFPSSSTIFQTIEEARAEYNPRDQSQKWLCGDDTPEKQPPILNPSFFYRVLAKDFFDKKPLPLKIFRWRRNRDSYQTRRISFSPDRNTLQRVRSSLSSSSSNGIPPISNTNLWVIEMFEYQLDLPQEVFRLTEPNCTHVPVVADSIGNEVPSFNGSTPVFSKITFHLSEKLPLTKFPSQPSGQPLFSMRNHSGPAGTNLKVHVMSGDLRSGDQTIGVPSGERGKFHKELIGIDGTRLHAVFKGSPSKGKHQTTLKGQGTWSFNQPNMRGDLRVVLWIE